MYYVYLVVLNCTRTVKDTSLMRMLSDVPTTQSCVQIYVRISELGTPLYTGQAAGSQWCPL